MISRNSADHTGWNLTPQHRKTEREELAKDVADFIKKGGKIKKLKSHQRNDSPIIEKWGHYEH
ncbi:MAG TPA: hypothetical protein VIZ65_00380 [Cellvibrionaceae bacterium]